MNEEKNSHQPNRREALRKMAMIPAAGVASVSVVRSFEEKCLAEEAQKKESIQGESGATRTSFTPPIRSRRA